MKGKKQTAPKPYTRMTAEELADATREYDRGELPDDVGKMMPRAERSKSEANKRGRGRPRNGLGAVNVLISFERGLLDQADAFARGRGIGRSALIAEALHAIIDGKIPVSRRRASA